MFSNGKINIKTFQEKYHSPERQTDANTDNNNKESNDNKEEENLLNSEIDLAVLNNKANLQTNKDSETKILNNIEYEQQKIELDKLKTELTNSEQINKELLSKLEKLREDYENNKEKNDNMLKVTESKIVNLVNRIADLEDENFKISHLNKDTLEKKKTLIMENQIKSFALEIQKLTDQNKLLNKKIKEKDNKLSSLNTEIKSLQDTNEYLTRTLNSSSNLNSTLLTNRLANYYENENILGSWDQPFDSTRNFLRKASNSPSFGESSVEGGTSNRFQNKRMMKIIKGGTKTKGNGFFAKMIGSNKTDTIKAINDIKAKGDLNNYREKQIQNEMKMLDNQSYMDDMSEI